MATATSTTCAAVSYWKVRSLHRQLAPTSEEPRSQLTKFHKLVILLSVNIMILGVVIISYEVLLHVFPNLMPSWYLRTLPLNGIELFHPGILHTTPIDGVPLPLMTASYSGPPIADIQYLGMVAPEDNPDPEHCPHIELVVDQMGLSNLDEVDSPDIIFVGDSYMVYAGIVSPPGLQLNLARATGLSIYNLGVPAIGPVREAWMLNQVGLPKQPKAVIWFFFAGNDHIDASSVDRHRKRNITNYAQLFPDFVRPRFYVLDMFEKHFLKDEEAQKTSEPIKGLILMNSGEDEIPVWFWPRYLRQLSETEDYWRNHPGRIISQDVIKEVKATVEQMGSEFIMVYIPSKPQVYLPYIQRDDYLIAEMAFFPQDIRAVSGEHQLSPEEFSRQFSQQAIDNRGSFEEVFEQFCLAEGITYISATPYLEELAASGEMGYFSADTHWNAVGQNTLVRPLADLLRKLDIHE